MREDVCGKCGGPAVTEAVPALGGLFTVCRDEVCGAVAEEELTTYDTPHY